MCAFHTRTYSNYDLNIISFLTTETSLIDKSVFLKDTISCKLRYKDDDKCVCGTQEHCGNYDNNIISFLTT